MVHIELVARDGMKGEAVAWALRHRLQLPGPQLYGAGARIIESIGLADDT